MSEQRRGVIYVATNRKNGKQYVGQAVSHLAGSGRAWGSNRRWQKHVKCAQSGKTECRLLECAIRKYGPESFTVEDVLECDISDLNQGEIDFIEKLNTLAPHGYNLMTGGGNGRHHSLETRKKISVVGKGRIHSDETKKKIGLGNSGKTVSDETRERIGAKSKCRNISEEHRDRIEAALSELGLCTAPMYVYMTVDRRGGRNVDIVTVIVPGHPTKGFGRKNMTLAEKYRLAIAHKESLLNGHRSEGSPQPR